MKRYDVLDGMRGVAAICVMVMHTTTHSSHPILESGYLAVDFFFILSGFVIAHSYGPRLDMNFTEFMCRRMIRLYPMFLFGLLIGGPILIVATRLGYTTYNNGSAFSSIVYNMFYLPFLNEGDIVSRIGAPIHAPIFPANDPCWSLFFEVVANCFFFAIFLAGRRRLAWFVGFCFLAIIANGVLVSLIDGKFGIAIAAGWGTKNFIGVVPRVFYGFGCGVLLYMFVASRWFEAAKAAMRRVQGSVYLLYGAMILIFMMPSIPHGNSLYYLLIIAVAAPVLVVLGAVATCDTKATLSVAKFLGWLSYPIYCLHFPIMRGVEILYDSGYGLGVPPFVVSILASVALAIIVTKIYDEPARAWLTRRLPNAIAWWSPPFRKVASPT